MIMFVLRFGTRFSYSVCAYVFHSASSMIPGRLPPNKNGIKIKVQHIISNMVDIVSILSGEDPHVAGLAVFGSLVLAAFGLRVSM
jgi:hypothetical protein